MLRCEFAGACLIYCLSSSPHRTQSISLSLSLSLSRTFQKNAELCVSVVALLVVCWSTLVRSDLLDHRYKSEELVPCYVNKVGPYANPSESYGYYSLPFCRPDHMEEEEQTLVEILNGDCFVNAPVQLKFRQKKDHEVMCRKNLTKQEVSHFQSAIEQDYYFQMYCDDLPIWGFIGWIERSLENGTHRHGLHHHFQFRIFYNKDQVIEIELRTYSNSTVLLSEGNQTYIEMLYSVDWIQTNAHFEGRMQKYLRPWHSRIHKGSVIKSSVTFLLLFSCLLIYYMRVVRTDFDNITLEESAVPVNQEQRGWKCLRSDVFRYPKYGCLLAAALGTGAQLCTLALSILLLGVMGIFYPYNRGNLWTALIVIYTITSGVSGHLAVSFYHQIGGKNWGRNLLLTGFFSFGPLFLTFSFINTIAMTYQANAAVPLGAVMKLLLIWTSLALPLLIVGGVTGKNNHSEFQAPCETSKCPREIPPLRWHRGTLLQMVLAGFLPFSCIYIQLLHIFRGLWSFWIYTTYGTLLVIFIILLITTSLVTVALTHFQLAAEDHQWWWRSFLCGGSVGLYVYGFCFYYYLYRSDFSGFLQLSFFFGYMAWISYCIFLLCGSVGFYASLLYVRHIYSSIKSD